MKITRILLVLAFLVTAALSVLQILNGPSAAAGEPPVLTCPGDTLAISVEDEKDILLSGVTAADPQDGDITDRILITGISRLLAGSTARVSFAVFDSDHNMASGTRLIRYTDYRLPRFSLDTPLVYRPGEQIVLLDRLRASDVIDGDLTNRIRVTYSDTTADPGVHSIRVQVTNSMGDTAWLTLPVTILEKNSADIRIDLDTYLVYARRGTAFDPRRYLNGASWEGDPVSVDQITITGQVDTAVPGTYRVEYTCTQGSHTGTAILTVVVE